ncbi:MAG: hypothetical protein V2A79_11000 [Planctomycetota bacterium]
MKNDLTGISVLALLLLSGAVQGAVFDSDGDGDVDLVDLQGFVACVAGPVDPAPPGCAVFDENGDAHVDLYDFRGFQLAFTGSAPAVITGTQLAGNSLSQYPFFEYVKAFNENATVQVAIDPTRFPDTIGRTCDIYVVEHKSSGGWAVDPSLVDVTAGGPLTETFGGATIQANTFTVTGAYELNADAGLGLGVGYDMVLDCNQDAELNGGDYIDGLGNEAGLYAVHDTTAAGPLVVTEIPSYSVGTVFSIPSGYTNEDLYYPTDIASMGQLPLIVVSHGNGHNYQWYDHIGNHMASYGYIVMSHQNNTGPGIETASTTTLGHTDAIIAQQGTIGGGVLNGHIDSHRIIWIGHSRGAEGVARAYDRIFDGYATTNYTLEDIILISSMLPVDFLGTSSSNPHGANYHLFTASGDADVDGSAGCDLCQTFHLHDRATRYRQSTVVQGTGHAWFHDGPESPSYFEGPCSIGPTHNLTHLIQLGYFLPLIKHYAEGNIPATDFLWRQYERFRPIGVPTDNPCIVVTMEYRNGADTGNFMIDNYETQTSTGTSSSGGAVTFTVDNVTEGRLDDNNSSFTWTTSDLFNGATQDGPADTGRGVVFDWNGANRYYEWEIITAERDLTDNLYLSFRSAQGTQHPYTLVLLGDETFTVTLRDGNGTTSSINIGAYGGGLEQPYQRSGGWHNEMEITRIRLTDFLTNGSGLDLADIAAVRLNVGPAWGQNEGRIVVDELMLTNDHPAVFTPLTISVPGGAPEFLPAGVPTVITVEIDEGSDAVVPGSARLHYRYNGGAFQTAPLIQVSGTLWHGTLPAPDCSDTPEFYFGVEGDITGPVYAPPGGSSEPFIAFVGTYVVVLDDDFEADLGWTVENIALTDGAWDRGIPVGGGDRQDPPTDYDGSGQCYLTDNVDDNSDVDGGPTMLISPTFSLSGASNPVLQYARWWANDDQDSDPFEVAISNDNGATWYLVETVANVPAAWVERSVYFTDVLGAEPLTATMKIRFSASDNPNNSIDEGGVDAVKVFDIECP